MDKRIVYASIEKMLSEKFGCDLKIDDKLSQLICKNNSNEMFLVIRDLFVAKSECILAGKTFILTEQAVKDLIKKHNGIIENSLGFDTK